MRARVRSASACPGEVACTWTSGNPSTIPRKEGGSVSRSRTSKMRKRIVYQPANRFDDEQLSRPVWPGRGQARSSFALRARQADWPAPTTNYSRALRGRIEECRSASVRYHTQGKWKENE